MRDVLVNSSLFRGVSPSIIATIVSGSQTRELAPTDALLRRGSENDSLYVVLSGSVSVRVPGIESAHARVGTGECVGELSLIDGKRVSVDVVADEPTVVLAIDQDQLWWLIESTTSAARNLLRILAGRIRHDDLAIETSGQQQRHLEHIATIDALTGLRNRRWLDEMFPRQLERATRTNQPASLLLIDVDYFKDINDTHGHDVGDAVLRRLADQLAANVRPQDMVARYGGEEFAVFLPGVDVQSARSMAERLRKIIDSPRADVGDEIAPPATVSIGVASRLEHDTLGELLRRADQSLYRAKQAGRNRIGD